MLPAALSVQMSLPAAAQCAASVLAGIQTGLRPDKAGWRLYRSATLRTGGNYKGSSAVAAASPSSSVAERPADLDANGRTFALSGNGTSLSGQTAEAASGTGCSECAPSASCDQLPMDILRDFRLELDLALRASPTRYESYVSKPTFFENQYGFPEIDLRSTSTMATAAAAGCSPSPPAHSLERAFLRPAAGMSLAGQFCLHRRGFKTLRSEISKGLSGLRRTPIGVLHGVPQPAASEKLKLIVEEFESAPQVQTKIKTAFAEGYLARGQSDGGSGSGAASAASNKSTWQRMVFRWMALTFVGISLYFVYMVSTAVSGGVRGVGFLNGDRFEVNPEDVTVTFEDVKGVDEAKQELQDIVEFLRNPDKFTSIGAKLPKGVLLVGPPGIGKTLLARAVAGEAGVPFFHASGSEFDEIFVGTGAKRVRQLFASAKMRAPCIIFIDEIDSVGARRTSSQIHPYANQTINQLLSEMDGFSSSNGVIVLGATNRRDNLDQAILRPGRFDVEVSVFPPDLKGRKDILELYLAKVRRSSSVDVDRLAKGTTGFTGADLENLVNQAALKAAIDDREEVTMDDMEFARDKVLMGPEKRSKVMSKDELWLTAYHEAGHTLVAYHTKEAMPLHKVTIIPRGQSLGHTSMIPDKEMYSTNRSQLLASLDVLMGGRVGEELVYGAERVTTGASDDFKRATMVATAMVKQYGMSDKVGVRVFHEDQVDSGLSMLHVNDVSPATTELVDSEIKRLLQESYERAKAILKAHSGQHKALASALMERETLDCDEIRHVIEGRGGGPDR